MANAAPAVADNAACRTIARNQPCNDLRATISPIGYLFLLILMTHSTRVTAEDSFLLVGLAKAAPVITLRNDNTFEAELVFTVANYGDGPLVDLQVMDDLATTFGATDFSVHDLASDSLSINPNFDGKNDVALLTGTDVLNVVDPPGFIFLRVRFSPQDNEGIFYNQAAAFALDTKKDQSTNGTDPDPNRDFVPSEAEPTPIPYERPLLVESKVGLAKAAATAVAAGDGSFMTSFILRVKNFGDVDLFDLQITDDLVATFRDTPFRILSIESDNLTVNPHFDGGGDRKLLTGSDKLAVEAEASVQLAVSFQPTSEEGEFFNQAQVQTGNGVTDLSTNGGNSDPNGDSEPAELEPTPIAFKRGAPASCAIQTDLKAHRRSASIGTHVGFTYLLNNTGQLAILSNVNLQEPSGLQISRKSAVLIRAGADGVFDTGDDNHEPLVQEPANLGTFNSILVEPKESLRITYASKISTAAQPGSVSVVAATTSDACFELANTTIEIVADPLFDEATIIGTVFNDENGNGAQDFGELGVPGVRLITAEGLLIETDRHGRYHIAGIEVGHTFGANYVVKLDGNSLPYDQHIDIRSDIRQVARLSPGGIAKINFAVNTDARLGQDCCAKHADRSVVDPFRSEKKLDLALSAIEPDRTVSEQEYGSQPTRWTFTFEVDSNFLTDANSFHISLYESTDAAFSRPLLSQCYNANSPRATVVLQGQLPKYLNRAVYRLHTLSNSSCGEPVPDSTKLLQTHAQQVELGRTAPGVATLSKRSPGESILTPSQSPNPGVRSLLVRQHRTDNNIGAYEVAASIVTTQAQLNQILPNPWQLQPTLATPTTARTLSSGEVIETAGFGSSPEVGADNGGIFLDRNSLFRVNSPEFSAQDSATTMACCDTHTSVQNLVNNLDQLVGVRVKNKSVGQQVVVCLVTPSYDLVAQPGFCQAQRTLGLFPFVELSSGATTEFYLPRDNQPPFPARSALQVLVEIEGQTTGTIAYNIQHSGTEQNGQWLPPTTTAICGDVNSTPKFTSATQLAAFRTRESVGGALPVPTTAEPPRDIETNANFGVALVDLTIGGYGSGSDLEAVSGGEYSDGTLVGGRVAAYWRGRQSLAKLGDLRWVLQMDSTKDELKNFADNLKRKDPKRLFRQLDSDNYYPTYGDDSTVIADTDGQGAFYARVELNNSEFVWGNYATNLLETEFAQYNRSIYGALLNYQSEATTEFGAHQYQLKLFGSEAQSVSARSVFQGTGGSLYYLKHTDIVQGSEKIWIEVRRRNTEQVEERELLIAGRDYEIDPYQGRVLLRRPLSQVIRERSNSVVRTAPIEGDDVLLMVDYEYLPDDFEADEYVVGMRSRMWIQDSISLGATHVQDNQGNNDYSLTGVDLVWRYRPNTYVSVEVARSEQQQLGDSTFSFDGGLTFKQDLPNLQTHSLTGNAIGFEAQVDLADIGTEYQSTNRTPARDQTNGLLRTWWKKREAGYSAGHFGVAPETMDVGADFNVALGESWQVNMMASELHQRGAYRLRTGRLQASKHWHCGGSDLSVRAVKGCTALDIEGRYENYKVLSDHPMQRLSALSYGQASLLGVRLGRSITPSTTVYASVQTTLDKSTDYQDNDLLAVGSNTRLNDKLALSVEISEGDRGDALTGGIDYSMNERSSFNLSSGVGSGALTQFASRYTLSEGHELYGTYTMNPDRTDNQRNLLTLGQRRDLGNRFRVYSETQFGHRDRYASSGHVFGLEYDHKQNWVFSSLVHSSSVDHFDQTYERFAISLGATFKNAHTRFSTRVEAREDSGLGTDVTQYVTSSSFTHQLNPAARVQAKLNLAWADDGYANRDAGRFVEFSLGYAYRPVLSDRFNGMVRYAYLYDIGTEAQSDAPGDERSHILSAEGLFEVTPKLQVGGKLALKQLDSRIQKGLGRWHDSSIGLSIARATWKLPTGKETNAAGILPDGLELLAEYRWMFDLHGDGDRRGALVGIFRQFDPRNNKNTLPIEATYRIGFGYNFSGFDDNLRRTSHRAEGWFIDLMAIL